MTDARRPKGGPTRKDRARIVRAAVLAASERHGRWEAVDLGDGRQTRIWRVDAGAGWCADLSSRFSGTPWESAKVGGYDEALLLQLAPPRSDDVVLDVWVAPFGKVLSIGATAGVDTLVTMRSGPWETLFGLDRREWSPSEARRLPSRASSG